MPKVAINPAVEAAEAARKRIHACIDDGKSFLVEAGAGAGKTYSLVEALKHVIAKQGAELVRRHQQVACITYTNVASDEITSRTDGHPAILSRTIHSFCWSLIRSFQPELRRAVSELENWTERLEEADGVGSRRVDYDLGYPSVKDDLILLGHNDVLAIAVKLMEHVKFRTLLLSRYPIIFIDEYQDTDKAVADAFCSHFLGDGARPLLGFFGDHWQKIYRGVCGRIEHDRLEVIGKEANFRSVPAIVSVLNRIRPELPQRVVDPNAQGVVRVYHTNEWQGERGKGAHYGGDLPAPAARAYLHSLREQLETEGWDFAPNVTKILILTHNAIAVEQGYDGIAEVFPRSESYIQKEDSHIAFFADVLEPVCVAYGQKRFGDMFTAMGTRTPLIQRPADKESWERDLQALMTLRQTGTIGQVIDHLRTTRRPRLPESVERKERELENANEDADADDTAKLDRLRALRDVLYSEVIALAEFLDEKTPFSTKHGVKGAEFENVLVVAGRGWNLYNFNHFLQWAGAIPADKQDAFERNRNLYYVSFSRPKTRLAVLVTQELSRQALDTLIAWFGEDNIQSFGNINATT
ncbi:MAG: AAA family ATPase [Planctomycetes bacterium]|nr:AAA family ATPase [Planctomycetota bacterium]